MRDGTPVYAVVKRPTAPASPSASYGAGMAVAGVASIGLGVGSVLGAQALKHHVTAIPSGVHNAIFAAAALFAVGNVLLGTASTVQGARYALEGLS
jgi:hypothetical protein